MTAPTRALYSLRVLKMIDKISSKIDKEQQLGLVKDIKSRTLSMTYC